MPPANTPNVMAVWKRKLRSMCHPFLLIRIMLQRHTHTHTHTHTHIRWRDSCAMSNINSLLLKGTSNCLWSTMLWLKNLFHPSAKCLEVERHTKFVTVPLRLEMAPSPQSKHYSLEISVTVRGDDTINIGIWLRITALWWQSVPKTFPTVTFQC